LSQLPFAKASSVAWRSHHKAASDQCPAPSSPGWSRAAAATRDWSRRQHRRACMQLVRHQRIEVSMPPLTAASLCRADVILSRVQRAHSRLSWAERLARNARTPTASQLTITLFGVPGAFAVFLGLPSSLRCEAHEWRVLAVFPSPSGTCALFTLNKSAWRGLEQSALTPTWVSSRCHAQCRFCQRKAKLTGHPLRGSARGRL